MVLLATLTAAGVSFVVEYLQIWSPSRYSTLNDLVTNSAGSAVGALLAEFLRGNPSPWFRRHLEQLRLAPMAALFTGLWFSWQLFPFVPRISWSSTLVQWTHPAAWSWPLFFAAMFGFAVLRYAKATTPWLVLAFAATVGQFVILDRSLSPHVVLGAAAGAVLAFPKLPRSWFAAGLLIWLLVDELRPFTFLNTPQEFSWAPFSTWFDAVGLEYYTVVFRKLFLYTATTWFLQRSGMRLLWTVGLPFGVLAVGEWMQRYLPGRTPEITDLALLMGGVVLIEILKLSNKAD